MLKKVIMTSFVIASGLMNATYVKASGSEDEDFQEALRRSALMQEYADDGDEELREALKLSQLSIRDDFAVNMGLEASKAQEAEDEELKKILEFSRMRTLQELHEGQFTGDASFIDSVLSASRVDSSEID